MAPLPASPEAPASMVLWLLCLDSYTRSGPSLLRFCSARFWWVPTACKERCKFHQRSSPHSTGLWLSLLLAVKSGDEEGRGADWLWGRMKNPRLLRIKKNYHKRKQSHDL